MHTIRKGGIFAIISAFAVLAVLTLLQGGATAAESTPVAKTKKPDDKVVVYFDNKAKDNGAIVFSFTPTGAETIPVRVTVEKGMDDEDSARAALKEFKVALGEDKYSYDLDDGVKVIIKGRKSTTFTLTLSEHSVPGLVVEIR